MFVSRLRGPLVVNGSSNGSTYHHVPPLTGRSYCSRNAGTAGLSWAAASAASAKHPQPQSALPCWGRRRGRHPEDPIGLEGMEESRSDFDKQLVEEQNGQWYQEAARKRRSVHNAGPLNRPGDRGHRLLALGQLLVSRTGKPGHDSGLTNAETTLEPPNPHKHSQRFLNLFLSTHKPRKRLASSRGLRP